MPIYEYQCSNCHHHFDFIQKINDEPLKQCPECGKETAVRLVSAAGFQLKGSGWYATDFKNKEKPVIKNDKTSDKDKKPETNSDKKVTETTSTSKAEDS